MTCLLNIPTSRTNEKCYSALQVDKMTISLLLVTIILKKFFKKIEYETVTVNHSSSLQVTVAEFIIPEIFQKF